jgi:hypothetical protein
MGYFPCGRPLDFGQKPGESMVLGVIPSRSWLNLGTSWLRQASERYRRLSGLPIHAIMPQPIYSPRFGWVTQIGVAITERIR